MELRNESIQGSALGGTVFTQPAAAPVIMPLSVAAPAAAAIPYAGYNTGFGGLESILALSLLAGGKGFGGFGAHGHYGYNPIGNLAAQASVDTRYEIAKSEADLKETLSSEFRGVDNNVSHLQSQTASGFQALQSALCGIKSDSIASKYEGIIASMASTNAISNKIDCGNNTLQNQNFALQTNMDRQFCDLKTDIERSFSGLKERELISENDQLRREQSNFIAQSNFSALSNQFNAQVAALATQNAAMMKIIDKFACATPMMCQPDPCIPVPVTHSK